MDVRTPWKDVALDVRAKLEISHAGRIGLDVVERASNDKKELRQLRGAFKCLKHDHPDNWWSLTLCGSYLKRLRGIMR